VSSANQIQLACLLDKIAELYRSGVPSHLITHTPRRDTAAAVHAARLRLVVIGTAPINAEEGTLLDAIATKGLGLHEGDYTKEVFQSAADAFAASAPQAPVTILFGDTVGGVEAPGVIIRTDRVSDLLSDPTRKKLLWKELQSRWPKGS
jgi:hypothetical protein